MTKRNLHLPSTCVGLGLASLPWLWSALAPTQTTQAQVAFGPYAWRELVRVEEAYPFVVPKGKALILVSVGHAARAQTTTLSEADTNLKVLIDGELELILNPVNGPNQILPGWLVPEGARVSVSFADDTWTGYVFGYLVTV